MSVFAQLMEVSDATTAPITPENLITNFFLGDGVEVIDVSFDGSPISVGYFKNGQNAVGIDRGIVLTSGRATSNNCGVPEQGGVDCTGNDFTSAENSSSAIDADLSNIAAGGLDVFDVAKYTITFIPTSDTLRFKYVFASEEYPEYGCSPFNDVFGFFISGPGISGPYQNNAQNIALIPNTTLPVSINNIHPQNPNTPSCTPLNAQYYNPNNGNNQPTYDGYLDVFVAEVIVIPCQTYVIKLAISDVGDPAYDSGVFLEAKSFGTGSLKVETATVSLDGAITEGCANGSITFSSPRPVADDFVLDYTIIGTAQNGVDYQVVPTNLFIPAGDSSITIDIVGIADGLTEPIESIGIDIQRDICNRDTFWMYIRDNGILPPDLGLDQTVCSGEPVSLDATLPIPLPDPPSFTATQDVAIANGTPAYSSVQVVGVQPFTLSPGVIQSVCVNIDHNWVDDLDLYLISPGGQFMELSSDNGSNCDDYTSVCFTPNNINNIGAGFPWPVCTSGGQPPFANGTFAPEGVWSDLWDGEHPTNGQWQLLAIDDQIGFSGTILDWTITFEPLYQVYYAWTPTDGLSCTDCPNPIATPTQTTQYVVTASDNYGCEVRDSIAIAINPTPDAPTISCTEVTTNSITFSWDAVGGPDGYMVSINGGTPFQTNSTNYMATGLGLDSAVTIVVYALNALCNGPIGTAICATPPCQAPSLSIINITNITCNGGTGAIELQATGGFGGYTYFLGNLNNTSGVFLNIPAGTYTFSVVDGQNCPNSITVSFSAPPLMQTMPQVAAGISCFGLSDATLSAPTTGGTAPYSFEWSNGQTDSIAVNIGIGQQIVTVTDDNGCTVAGTVTVTQPSPLTTNANAQPATCNGTPTGAVQVVAAGGTSPYGYLWDAAAGNASTALVNDLAAGTYSVTVTDDNGCTAITSATIGEPTAVTLAIINTTNPECNGTPTGSITASGSGGTGTLNYTWSNNSTAATASNLVAGSYSVTVSDANGCSAMQSATLTDPPALVVELSVTDVTCFGGDDGSIFSTIVGGGPPFEFFWSNSATSDVIINIPAGNYCVTVNDGNGCTSTACETVEQPTELQLMTDPTNIGCLGTTGSIDLSVIGGIPPYQYSWDNGETTEDIADLSTGGYTVTVSDANNCSRVATAFIQQNDLANLVLTQTGVSCEGGNDGSIQATASGGSGGFVFDWSGPNGYDETTANPTNLFAGIYYVTATDAIGCAITDSIEVTEENVLDADLQLQYVSCFGEMDGRIIVTPFGGQPPYLISFDSAAFASNTTFYNLDFGLYDLTVRDANGCEWTQEQIFIGEPKELRLNLGPDTILPYGTTLELAPNVVNLNDPDLANFLWESNNSLMPPLDSSAQVGEFIVTGQSAVTLTVVDKNGCTVSDLINIFVRSNKTVVVPTGFAPGTGGNPLNDLLHVHGSSDLVKAIKIFRIFDRWGELLFEAADFPINDNNTGWNGEFKGQEMPAGVYAWYLEVEFVDGQFEKYKGETTLIR